MKFDNDFFNTEVREGFEISSMMKRAWAAQMEVFQVVSDICNRNGIRYFADFGTLLGAVRHKGMIPWDDDIDICMMRSFTKSSPVVSRSNTISGFVRLSFICLYRVMMYKF